MVARTLASLLTANKVARLAGPRSYSRGVGYHDDGRVEIATMADSRVDAVVRGTMPYGVTLRLRGQSIEWSCTCPVGADGDFCKHCVAVAVSIQPAEAPKPTPAGRRARVQSLKRIDEREWRKRLRAAFAPGRGGFVDYAKAPMWAAGVGDALDALDELIDAGHAATVVALAEHAHRLADGAMQYIDDSDGWLSGISGHLGEIHLRACRVASPDRVELARRLADLELTAELDTFHRVAATYADVLGSDGLAEYRRVIEPRWRKLKPKADEWSMERFRLREAMTGIALAAGDPDELARVKQHDLRTPDDYREVAESLRSAGRTDEALDWARRGLEAYADRSWQTPPLRELLAEMLWEQGDPDAAIDAFWQAFEAHPSIDAYRRLLAEAKGAGQQDEWRKRAVAALRDRVAERRPDDTARSITTVTPAVALVEVLLHGGDVDCAWATATTYGCTDRLWLTLARARGRDHPLDAIPVYEQAVHAQIDARNNKGYRTAVDHLAAIEKLADQARDAEQFHRVLTDIRSKHKQKRNLMALLDARGWSGAG